jgi:hypothetical protein
MPSRKTGKRKKLNPPGLSQTVRRRDDLQYNLESNHGAMLSDFKTR